jgi:hypothetical protein
MLASLRKERSGSSPKLMENLCEDPTASRNTQPK